VRPGRHELRAVLAGYDEYVGIVEAGPGVVIAGKAILVPARVPCRVDAEPEGAELWIDGSLVGKTPWNGALRPGRYSMEARMEGYEPAAETVSVAFASAMGTSLRLSPRPAVLVVESEPLGALVDLNGEQLGRTPLRIETKAFEARYVSLRPPDFIYAASDPVPIELRPGEESKVSLRFAKKSAPLGFKPSVGLPAGAVVLVDGERFDTVPTGDKALEFGAHDIEIRADGYDAISQSVSWDGLWGRRLAMTRRLPKVAVDGIKVDGAIADWAGIAPIFIDPAGDDKSPKVSGTDLVAVYAASDGLYLYVRMDFADGVFRANGSDWREQCLKIHGDRDGSSQYFIYLSLIAEGTTLEPRIRVNKAGPSGEPNVKKVTSGCSFRNGDGLVEMRFPLSAFSAYVKNGDVFNFWSHVGPDYPKGTDETERIDVRIR
ncbi:MAG: PEGA domain-containing protein, partial [Spirochaetes bacterium]|nr:PEGA domain-containing protein [Spirochaetota bacterium]